MADAYLPHVVENVPCDWVLGHDGRPFPRIANYIQQGVVRVIAGPHLCHVVIDVRRPYFGPPEFLPAPFIEGRAA